MEVLAIHGFHHGLGYLFTTQGVQNVKTNPLGLDFGGSYFGALLIAVLAPVYIFYGFESAGDISEETKDAGRQVPRAMRHALIWGGVASFIVIAALLLSIPAKGGFAGAISSPLGAVPYILSQLPSGIQDFALLLLIFAFFSCGTSIQGAGSRLMFSYSRDGALPASKWISTVHPRFKTPVNAHAGRRGAARLRSVAGQQHPERVRGKPLSGDVGTGRGWSWSHAAEPLIEGRRPSAFADGLRDVLP